MKSLKIPPDYYDQSIKTNLLQRFYHLTRFKQILKMVGKIEGNFLDVGCASGLLTERLATQSRGRGWGIDINQDFIALAQKEYPFLHFMVARVEKLPFSKEKFDAVVCSEILEHIVSPQKALGECQRVLKRNGRILVVVPSESLLFRLLWFFWTKGKGRVWDGAHLHHFKEGEIRALLEKLNFKILRQCTFQLGMLSLIEAQKI